MYCRADQLDKCPDVPRDLRESHPEDWLCSIFDTYAALYVKKEVEILCIICIDFGGKD